MKLNPAFKDRYGKVPQRSIFGAVFGSTFVSALYWTSSMDDAGLLFTALGIAAYSTAGLLIGLEGARWAVPAWRNSPTKPGRVENGPSGRDRR
ncbi:hypothetical protein [Candidatus Palauibacter sp.]|uniref:hypothetical protein n=1 Tax=Candidatus Palauibacter sp. TaxID=3101350 RepID=UPI003B022960